MCFFFFVFLFFLKETFFSFVYRKHNSVCSSQLGGQFFGLCLFHLGNASYQFEAQNIASPVTVDLIVSVIVIGPDSFHQLSQRSFVFQINLCEGDDDASLSVD
uniref:Uncharacterized protein n=1 Tax=Rhinolophus ferrumequinum TaxID=59479 RepID=A0A671EL82_RHIFE